MARKKREINTSLLDSVTADMLGGDDMDFFQDDSLRVERILLELVRPDPLQPRRVLPDRIYQAFHDNRLTPTQALRELIQTAQLAARQQGRPFNNILDLLGNPDDESEQDLPPLSPEEQLVHDLVNLAITIRDDGQVNPLTVIEVSEGVTRQFRIETGERRYWATWLLRDFISGYESDGMIPCIVIPYESASAFRQAKENTARKGLTAIAMARQAALLLLTVHGCEIPVHAVNNDFYRQALDLDLRGKREYTDAILSAMGGITRSYFSYYKSLLKLPDEAMELADRHNIDAKKLRYVAAIDPNAQLELIRQIIDFDLTSKQVKQLIESSGIEDEIKDSQDIQLSQHSVKVAKSMRDIIKTNGNELAQALLFQEKDVHVALARLRAMQEMLIEAEKELMNS